MQVASAELKAERHGAVSSIAFAIVLAAILSVCNANAAFALSEAGASNSALQLTTMEDADSFTAGSGTADDPYQIATAADLKLLSAKCADADAADDYRAKHYVLTADIDLANEKFTPIGTLSKPFAGRFDGQGHSVSGLNVTSGASGGGLFGTVGGGDSDTVITDFTIASGMVKVSGNGSTSGSVAGTALTKVKISKIVNKATVECASSGGILGGVGKVATNPSYYAGDVVIDSCVNSGAITAVSSGYNTAGNGGIVGIFNTNMGNGTESVIQNCINTATVKNAKSKYGSAGGVVGCVNVLGGATGIRVENCVNTAAVSNTQKKTDLGGVLGGVVKGGTDDLGSTIFCTVSNSYAVSALLGTSDITKANAQLDGKSAQKTSAEINTADFASTMGSAFAFDSSDSTLKLKFQVKISPEEEAAQAVMALIDAIPATVTLDNEGKVAAAREAYEAADAAAKALVTNLDKLTAAEKTIADLKEAAAKAAADKEAADAVIALIDALPAADAATADTKAAADKAKEEFAKLTDDQKALVSKELQDKLDAVSKAADAAKEAADQKAAADKEAADAVIALINALPAADAATADAKTAADKAKEEFAKLTDDQKALVSRELQDKLDAVSKAADAAKEAADQKAAEEKAAADKKAAETKAAAALAAASTVKKGSVTAADVKRASDLGATSITLGAGVKKIAKGAFKGTKIKTIVIASKKLKKSSVKGCLKGSKVKTVKVQVGNKKASKKAVKAYKKIFTKKIAGKKVKVK